MADFAKELGQAFEKSQKQNEDLKKDKTAESDPKFKRISSKKHDEEAGVEVDNEAYRGRGGRGRGNRGEYRGRGGRGRGAPDGEGESNYRGRRYNNRQNDGEVDESGGFVRSNYRSKRGGEEGEDTRGSYRGNRGYRGGERGSYRGDRGGYRGQRGSYRGGRNDRE